MEINLAAIFIPTKGRFDSIPTLKLLDENLLSYVHLVVEPQDYEFYRNNFTHLKFIQLPENDKGIGYARKEIINYCKLNKINICTMMDDNIEEFVIREGKTAGGHPKLVKKQLTTDYLHSIACLVNNGGDYAQVGVSFKPTNWCYPESFKQFGRCWAMFCINVARIGDVNFDEKLQICEDFDFSIQLIKDKKKTGVVYEYAFYKEMGASKYKGGNHDFYKKVDKTKEQTEYLENKHPECCKQVFSEKHGIYEVKVSWKDAVKKSETKSLMEF